MNLKEFLKPELRKFLVFLAIPIGYIALLNVFEQISALVKNESLTLVFSGISGVLLGIIALPALLVLSALSPLGIESFPDVPTESIAESWGVLFLVLLTIFWVYVLSCMMVFAYDKLRHKK